MSGEDVFLEKKILPPPSVSGMTRIRTSNSFSRLDSFVQIVSTRRHARSWVETAPVTKQRWSYNRTWCLRILRCISRLAFDDLIVEGGVVSPCTLSVAEQRITRRFPLYRCHDSGWQSGLKSWSALVQWRVRTNTIVCACFSFL